MSLFLQSLWRWLRDGLFVDITKPACYSNTTWLSGEIMIIYTVSFRMNCYRWRTGKAAIGRYARSWFTQQYHLLTCHYFKDLIVVWRKVIDEKYKGGDLNQFVHSLAIVAARSYRRQKTGRVNRQDKTWYILLICSGNTGMETAEYVRDAKAKGDNISLVCVGPTLQTKSPDRSLCYIGWRKKSTVYNQYMFHQEIRYHFFR